MDIANGSVQFHNLEINVDALNKSSLRTADIYIVSGTIKSATAMIS